MFDPAFNFTLWKVLVGVLAVACPLALITRRWQLAAVTALLLLDWSVCTFVPDLTMGGDVVYNWIAWGFVDILIGLIMVVLVADNLVALAIAFILICEIAAHLAFGSYVTALQESDRTANFIYWTITHWGAWLQVYLLAFWIGTDAVQSVGAADIGGMFRRPDRSVRRSVATRLEGEEGK